MSDEQRKEETKLNTEIIQLTKDKLLLDELLLSKKETLFNTRMNIIINHTRTLEALKIQDIKFTTMHSEADGYLWQISYTHETNRYDENNYVLNSDSETDDDPISKTTSISFGKAKKYYIKGNHNQFKIYKNSSGILRIINTNYDIELAIEEQETLIKRYSNLIDIPEWIALRFFIFMSENEWTDNDVIKYLSV